jgi:hypothetical protein
MIEASRLWDDVTCHVWRPAAESVVRVASERLKPVDAAEAGHPARIRYVLYAARITRASGGVGGCRGAIPGARPDRKTSRQPSPSIAAPSSAFQWKRILLTI